MNSIKSMGSYFSNKTKGAGHGARKEANKSVAKDGNVRMSTRLRAAGDAVGDKMHESSANRKAAVNKQGMKHNY